MDREQRERIRRARDRALRARRTHHIYRGNDETCSGLAGYCYEMANGNGWVALSYAVEITVGRQRLAGEAARSQHAQSSA